MVTTLLADGLIFPEDPRWRDGKLWFSDIYAHCVMTLDLAGHLETVAEIPTQPSGLGWTPDGRLLVVSMIDRCLLRLDDGGPVPVADLSSLASYYLNDMVVDAQGRAYIGNLGYDCFTDDTPPHRAEIVMVTGEGRARVVADQLVFPNGSVITPDGKTLIVAETFTARLSAFNIEADGSLSNRRVWAQFDTLPAWEGVDDRVMPDGICLDAEGAVWVASPSTREVIRVHEGGRISQRIPTETGAYACMLGGPQRRTLFILSAETSDPIETRRRVSGRVEYVEVDVPGAGLP